MIYIHLFALGNEAVAERRVLAKWEQDMFLEEVKNEYYNEAYQILLLLTLIVGLYLIVKRSWPNFFTSKLVGFYSLCLGFLVLSHISYVTQNSGDVLIIVKDTIDNLLANFSNKELTSVIIPNGVTIIGNSVINIVIAIFKNFFFIKI